ncbi:NifB/NifX family molybdenum-iron cluster-binding protein [Thermodesulfobacteriota bacterium]
MKIAVSANQKNLDSSINPRFGRCPCFLIVETEDMTFESYDNENIALSGGAGIQTAQFVTSKGAKSVITGAVGPNARRALAAAGVQLVTGQTGTVREAIVNYKKGKLEITDPTSVSGSYGMVGQGGMGSCMGPGRGMGRGRGK